MLFRLIFGAFTIGVLGAPVSADEELARVPGIFHGLWKPVKSNCEIESDDDLYLGDREVYAYRFQSTVEKIRYHGRRLSVTVMADSDFQAEHRTPFREILLERGHSKRTIRLDGMPYQLCSRHLIHVLHVDLPAP